MAGETGGTGEEGGRHGVGDRGTAERTLDHCCGRRGQVHGCPGRETSMTRLHVLLFSIIFFFRYNMHSIVVENIVVLA